jgi:membrane protein DedA with SNARE-associated domain
MPDSAALWVYLGVFGTLLGAGLVLPIPEDLPIVTAGVWVGAASQDPDNHLRWWIMLPICIAGVVIGDAFLYTIGRVWGHRLLRSRWVQRKVLPPDRQVRYERLFHRHGIWILLFARMLPGIRGPIFLAAGINRLPIAKFLLADGLYAIPGVSLIFTLAYWFTDQFRDLVLRAEQVRPLIVLIVIGTVIVLLIRYFLKHPISTGDPEDVPIIGQQIASHLHGTDGNSAPPDQNAPEAPEGGQAPPKAS